MALGRLLFAAAIASALCGCSPEVKQHIRQRDFRQIKRAEMEQQAAPSPIADVLDMPGWTTDLDGAQAFARVNNRKVVALVFKGGDAASERAKEAVNAASPRMGNAMRVAVDAMSRPQTASRFQVSKLPALIVFGPDGGIVAQQGGNLTQTKVDEALKAASGA